MLPCTVCGQPFPYARGCDQAHAGVCHACHGLNLAGAFDAVPHPGPHPGPHETPARLSASDTAAVQRYMQHVQAVYGTEEGEA